MTVSYTVLNGQPISQTRDGVTHNYILDPGGNLVALVDENGNISDTFEWWPFGELMSRTGNTVVNFGWKAGRQYMKGSEVLLSPSGEVYDPRNAQVLNKGQKKKHTIPDLPNPDWMDCIWKSVGGYPWPKCPLEGYGKSVSEQRRCWSKIIRCLIWCETGGKDDPNAGNPNSTALGLMQVLEGHEGKDISCCVKDPKTGTWSLKPCKLTDRTDPCQNISFGTYLLWSRVNKSGDLSDAKSAFDCIGLKRFNDCIKDYDWPAVK